MEEAPIYRIATVSAPGAEASFLAPFHEALKLTMSELGVSTPIEISPLSEVSGTDQVTLVLVLGSEALADDDAANTILSEAVNAEMKILPVLGVLESASACLPPAISNFNAIKCSSPADFGRVALTVLTELRCAPTNRRVFISYRRSDSARVAEQLFDALRRRGMLPFMDLYSIAHGKDTNDVISDWLEGCALVVLLESASAHESRWVEKEVLHAISSHVGLHILSWPGDYPRFSLTDHLHRHALGQDHFEPGEASLTTLKEEALTRIVESIERSVAAAAQLRWRQIFVDVKSQLSEARGEVVTLPGWRLKLVKENELIEVVAHHPTLADLVAVDEERIAQGCDQAATVHPPRIISVARKQHLDWAIHQRPLALVRSTEIGARWGAENGKS